MKKTYLLLLLLSTASMKGYAQESQTDLLFRFLGTSEEQDAMTQDERIEETKALYAKIKEMKAAKKTNLMNGLAAGFAMGASAVANGIEAGRQQQAANAAARAEQKARDEQRTAAARTQQQNFSNATRSASNSSSYTFQAQDAEQSIKNRANSMAAEDARSTSIIVNQYQLASVYENLIKQYPNYNNAQIRQMARNNQSNSQSRNTSTNASMPTEKIIQCVVVKNGTLTAAKLRVSATGVVNGYTFGGKGGGNNDYNWTTPALQNFIPVQTHDSIDGNIAREYSKKINVGNYTFYFN